MSTGMSWRSPVRDEMPSRISSLKPEETETAIIMTRNETAMETIAIFPPKRKRLAMNLEASKSVRRKDYQMWTRSLSGRHIGSPSLMPKASKNDWKFLTATLTLLIASECTSSLVSLAFSSSVMFCAQIAP